MEKCFIYQQEKLKKVVPDFKEQYGYFLNPFIFFLNGNPVVYGECMVKDNEIEIQYIKSIDTRKGYATLFINHLIQDLEFTEVWGESVVESFLFWEKVGAVFDETSENYFRKYAGDESVEFEEEFLIPFTITN